MRILSLVGYVLLSFLFLVLFVLTAGIWFHSLAHAHLADRPDLNKWAAGLRSDAGLPCCDGTDAEPIMDPDWRADPKGNYQVRIENEWVDVPASAVVPGPNKYGRALVWGYWMLGETKKFSVRCFMPAGGV